VSNEARHRDITALFARSVKRVKKQPLVAKAIETNMPIGQSHQPARSPDSGTIQSTEGIQNIVGSEEPRQLGGDQ
jgi:hypothetical protein